MEHGTGTGHQSGTGAPAGAGAGTGAAYVFQRWEIRFAIDYAMMELTKTCFMLAVACHWFACIWGIQATFDPLNSWQGEEGFCVAWNGTDVSTDCPPDRVCTIEPATACYGPWVLYMDAMCAHARRARTRDLPRAHLSQP